jgi:hypothetical protein
MTSHKINPSRVLKLDNSTVTFRTDNPFDNLPLVGPQGDNILEGKAASTDDSVGQSKVGKAKIESGPLVDGELPESSVGHEKKLTDEELSLVKLRESIRVIIDYLNLFGFDENKFKTKPTIIHWQLCSKECGWMKFLKYKFSSFFALFLGSQLPQKPFSRDDNPLHFIGGSAGRFISIYLRDHNFQDNLAFVLGFLYLKKGLPRPSMKEIRKSMKETMKVLTTKQPIIQANVTVTPSISESSLWEEKLETPRVTMNDLTNQVRRTCRDLLRGAEFGENDLYTPYAPSVHANYLATRKKFGTFGELMERGLVPFPSGGTPQQVYNGCLLSSLVDEEEGSRIGIEDLKSYYLNPEFQESFLEDYKLMFERIRSAATMEEAKVTLVGLAEALKVRTISKGPPLTYFCLKPLQKFLHNILRKHRTLRLIGEPVSEEILNNTFKGVVGKFLSLDYQSATDLLNPELSLAAVDEISEILHLSPDLANLFEKALVGHLIIISDNAKKVRSDFEKAVERGLEKETDFSYYFEENFKEIFKEQVWGQLMGSIISFIILCIVNLSVCRYSYEIGENSLFGTSLEDIPLLINGDDGVMKCSDETRRVWSELSRMCGLIPSIGKVYYHDTYLNINSTSYLWDEETQSSRLIPYVNMGLVNGLTRSSGKAGMDEVSDVYSDFSIGSRHHELMNSCPEHLKLNVHKLFIKKHFDVLSKTSLPWYVNEEFGGVGLKPFIITTNQSDYLDINEDTREYLEIDGHRYGPSETDLHICRILANNIVKNCRVNRLSDSQPFRARQVWYGNKGFDVPSNHYIGKPNSQQTYLSDLNASVMGFLDVSAFYLCPRDVTSVLDNSNVNLRNNERAWSYLLKAHHKFNSLPGFKILERSFVSKPILLSNNASALSGVSAITTVHKSKFKLYGVSLKAQRLRESLCRLWNLDD